MACQTPRENLVNILATLRPHARRVYAESSSSSLLSARWVKSRASVSRSLWDWDWMRQLRRLCCNGHLNLCGVKDNPSAWQFQLQWVLNCADNRLDKLIGRNP